MVTKANKREVMASLSVVCGGVLWGVYWLPLRFVEHAGISGAWPNLLLFIGLSLLFGVFFLIFGKKRSIAHWLHILWCGLFMGTAFTFYSISLFYTDVIRSILLFYMMPVWSTILGVFYLGEKLTIQRVLALLLGGAGLLTILGIGLHIPLPENLGDWLSLAAGILWAYGTYAMFKFVEADVFEQSMGVVVGGLLSSLVLLLIGGAVFSGPLIGGVVGWHEIGQALPAVFLLMGFVLPILYLTLWPVTIVSPARLGILLMSEVLVGVVSAALLSGEPFGWREFIGALFIGGAGLVEVLPAPRKKSV